MLKTYEGLERDIEFAATQTCITGAARKSMVSVASEFLDAIVEAAAEPTERGGGDGDAGNWGEEEEGELSEDRGGSRTYYYPYETTEDGPKETGLYSYVYETEEETSAKKTTTSAAKKGRTTGTSAEISPTPAVSSVSSETESEVPAVSEQPASAAAANSAAGIFLLGAAAAGAIAVVALL